MNLAKVASTCVGLLPHSPFKLRLLALLGWSVHSTAVVGPSLFVNLGTVRLAEGAVIGSFSTFRNLQLLELGDGATVGQWNWITANPLFQGTGCGDFCLAPGAAVTSRHYLDCSGGITIGAFTTVAGVRSVFFSHGIDIVRNRQVPKEIVVGSFCMIGSNVSIRSGVTIADRTVVGMGSVIVKDVIEPGQLWAGNPAVPKAETTGAYFERSSPRVDP